MSRAHAKKPSRFWLYFPFLLLLLAAGAWTGWWFYARDRVDAAVDRWIAEQTAAGAEVSYASRTLSGFPFRYDLVFGKPDIRGADGVQWQGDELQLVMQPWDFRHIIARAPGHHVVTTALGLRNSVELDGKAAASLSWTDAGPRRIGLQSGDASAVINGHAYDLSGFVLNLAPRPESPDDLMVALQWDKLSMDEAPATAPYLGTELGPSRLIGEVRNFFPAYAHSDHETGGLWRALLEVGGGVEVAQMLVDWGPMDLGGKADLTIENGRANGSIGLRLDHPDTLKEAMMASGHWSTMEQTVLGTLEPASRNDGFLTLVVIDSRIFAGPVPLGALPGSGS
ncbi:MAG: DUF2125 domain-containing protein [Hyphomonas sp.]|nr:DUF2125 domain-containing protein [Hyphomonas sp.]HPE48032.1 DUF2125 domain-containing protein [Hyphomonas sp.]